MKVLCEFSVPGAPVPKGRPRLNRKTGVVYTPPTTAAAEQRIQTYLGALYPHLKPTDSLVTLQVYVHIRGAGRGDWDNYGKLVSDALNGIVYHDDEQVVRATVAVDRHVKEPRTEITVWEYAGEAR